MTTHRTILGASAAALAAVAASFAVAQADTTPPVVSITGTKTTATVTGAGALKAGPTTLTIITAPNRSLSIAVLKPGKTVAELVAAAKKSQSDATPALKVADLIGGGSGTARRPYSYTANLRAGTYEIVDDTNAPKIEAQFTVAAGSNGASLPHPASTIKLTNFAIRPSGVIHPGSLVQITNDSPSPHFLLAFKLKRPADASKALSLLKKGGASAKKAEKLVAGESELVDLISSGVTEDVDTTGLSKGTYVLVCFYSDATSHHMEHSMLGMEAKAIIG